ncbi:hypothetical protein [Sulfitobacter sp. EhC04]|uniref:hypothetical protein n=1 Tax=Sulfitobacter sp. EhC04 TaxID=1849168 RepID=UPI0010FD28A7|nr:hypothetical protein [Sulfitobacter sp. EhC04]
MKNLSQYRIMALGLVASVIGAPLAADVLSTTSPTIRNNLCVGGSCLNDESFSGDFNQIVVKASNTRLLFEDATTLANFPSDDWALQANERVINGRNQFMLKNDTLGTIPVTVQAGAGENALFLADTGRIGMGTSMPQTDLHIVGSGATVGLRMQTSGASSHTWAMQSNQFNWFMTNVTDNNVPFVVRSGAGTNTLVLDDNSFVGIGTPAPEELLHIRSSTPNTDAFALFDATAAGSDSAFRLRQNGTIPSTWEFRNQQSSGRLNVGIAGGNTPLKIDNLANNNLIRLGRNGLPGEVNITGTLVVNNTQLNVPDYVFADDYALRPLAEVRAFIDKNSHLPDVPSEAEIKANGVDMTAMQMTLLKKVEELTLYTLELEQARAAQQAQIAELQGLVLGLRQMQE